MINIKDHVMLKVALFGNWGIGWVGQGALWPILGSIPYLNKFRPMQRLKSWAKSLTGRTPIIGGRIQDALAHADIR